MQPSKYEEDVLNWLSGHSLDVEIFGYGIASPPWAKPGTHRASYGLTIGHPSRGEFRVPVFYASLDHTLNHRDEFPSAYEILSCLQWHEPETFEKWCFNTGYNSDSRKAYATWEEVVAEHRRITDFFSQEEIIELSELCQ